MKVYILEGDVSYEGSWVVDVFKFKKDADKARDAKEKEKTQDDVFFTVHTWEVKS